ncbi:hypothetical protein [Natrialba sp. INN-245]|uniref:hypothetical protein n=1 Tax=Natrialba sp. INN-245 TaxID=2690967 RepID=UPI001313323D|nr:hypothetical protein [Natrialba sp. INN-245]MWV41630.1 hypothetical protein [Natrialba sp. INN-245]
MAPSRRTILRSTTGIALTTTGLSVSALASDDDHASEPDESHTRGDAEASWRCDDVHASLELFDGRAIAAGRVTTPTPCHEPVLADVEGSDDSLSVTIDSERADGRGCPDVISCADYEEPFALPDSGRYTGLSVVHASVGDDVSVLEATVSSRKTDCDPRYERTEDERTTVEIDGNAVRFAGRIVAPTPCHEVVFRAVDYDGDDVTVDIGLASTLEDGQLCPQAITCFAYRGVVRLLEGASIDDAAVAHADAE